MHQYIRWIKNISNKTGNAYLSVEDRFMLAFPAAAGAGNVKAPQVGDLIILWQKVNGRACLTHLVTPEDDTVYSSKHPEYPLERQMRVIAISKIPELYRENTSWKYVYFGGISNGNFCRLNNIKSIDPDILLPTLQQETWQFFQPFLIEARQPLKISEETLFIDAGFLPEDYSALEGRTHLIQHLAYERDRRLVSLRKELARQSGKLFCEACGFDFQKKYGQDFIECHHLAPIAQCGLRENNLDDLALVCSNCHRMLHRKIEGQYLSIVGLKSLLMKLAHLKSEKISSLNS